MLDCVILDGVMLDGAMLDGMMVGLIDDTISGMLSFMKHIVSRNTSAHT